jgi:hypothetical protein
MTDLCPACRERPVQVAGRCKRCYDRAWRAAHPGYVTARVRKYRSDPVKAERDREISRRWKREHLGQPGKPATTPGGGDD